ncbi:uncharacterized protein [Haliotis asinina]|uniref:uncharacterized protein n=1 Tax=Haliotis asinina TaxID=109174 RepID=UPI003531D500
MDIIVLVLLSVCGQVVSLTLRQCPDSSVWSVDLHDCIPCMELCPQGDERECPESCRKRDAASLRQNSHHLRQHRNGRYKRDEYDCDDFNYYDTAIHRCTPCDHLCDHHEYQGTTERCREKCPDYYARMGLPTSSPKEKSTKDKSSDESKGDATLTLLIIFVIVLVLCIAIGTVVWKRNEIWQFLGGLCTYDEEKTSVQCSQEEGICESANSKTPLTHSLGPICQPATETSNENRADHYPYTETFSEIDLRYAVLDEPLISHTTIPKQACCTDHSSQTCPTYHSTTPKQTVSSNGTNLTTYTSHSTIPKVVDADSDGTSLS